MDTKKHVQELLSVYLDQMCSVEEKKTVEIHLAGCVECRQELEDLRKTLKLVTSLKEIEPPDNLWEGVANRIQKRSFWKIFVWPRFSGVAIATVAILFLAVTVNKYSTRIAEQAKTGTMKDVTVEANMPLTLPLLSPKPVQSLEKKDVAKTESRPAPAVDILTYNEKVARKNNISDYAHAPQQRSGFVSVSQQKGKLLNRDAHPSSSYVIEMEVDDMERTRQRLQALAESYQARRVARFSDDRDLFYHVQQQQLSAFIREVNKLSKDSHPEVEYERLEVSPSFGGLGTGSSSQPKLIQIKFNTAK